MERKRGKRGSFYGKKPKFIWDFWKLVYESVRWREWREERGSIYRAANAYGAGPLSTLRGPFEGNGWTVRLHQDRFPAAD